MNGLNLKLIMEVVDKITSPVRGIATRFQTMIKSMSASVAQLANTMDKVGKKTAEIGGFLTSRLTLPIVGIGALSVRAAGQVEELTMQFEHLAGGADKARGFIRSLQGYIDKFGVEELGNSVKLLETAGYGMDEIRTRLGFIGEVAAGSRTSLAALTEQYIELRKAGKVSDGDLSAMMKANIPIVQELAKQLGKTEQQIWNMAADGKIAFEDYRKAMVGLTEEGGRFHGAMERQSKSINGVFKELKNSLSSMFAELGAGLWEDLQIADKVKAITNAVRGLVEGFLGLPKGVKSAITWFVLIVAAIGPVVLIIGQLTVGIAGMLLVFSKLPIAFSGVLAMATGLLKGFKLLWGGSMMLVKVIPMLITGVRALGLAFIANPIGLFITAIVALGVAAYMLIKHWDKVKAFFAKLWGYIKPYFMTGLNAISTLLKPFTFLPSLIIDNWSGITGFFSGLWDGISNIFKTQVEMILTFIQPMIDAVKWLIDGLASIGRVVGTRIKKGYEHLAQNDPDGEGADRPAANYANYRGSAANHPVTPAPAMPRGAGGGKVDAGGTVKIHISQDGRARVAESKSNDKRINYQTADTGVLMGGM